MPNAQSLLTASVLDSAIVEVQLSDALVGHDDGVDSLSESLGVLLLRAEHVLREERLCVCMRVL
jgi:hypothetical protein